MQYRMTQMKRVLTSVCSNKNVENYGQHCLCHRAQLIDLHAFAFVRGICFCRSGNNIAHNKYSCTFLFSGMQSFGALQYQLLPESGDGFVLEIYAIIIGLLIEFIFYFYFFLYKQTRTGGKNMIY